MYYGTVRARFTDRVQEGSFEAAAQALAGAPKASEDHLVTPMGDEMAVAQERAGVVLDGYTSPALPRTVLGYLRRTDRVPVGISVNGTEVAEADLPRRIEALLGFPAEAAKGKEDVAYLASVPRPRRVVRVGVDELTPPRGPLSKGTWWVLSEGNVQPVSVVVDGTPHLAGSPGYDRALSNARRVAAQRHAAKHRDAAKRLLGL